jgi:hypothetical protein
VDIQSIGAIDIINWDAIFDPSSFIGENPLEVARH